MLFTFHPLYSLTFNSAAIACGTCLANFLKSSPRPKPALAITIGEAIGRTNDTGEGLESYTIPSRSNVTFEGRAPDADNFFAVSRVWSRRNIPPFEKQCGTRRDVGFEDLSFAIADTS